MVAPTVQNEGLSIEDRILLWVYEESETRKLNKQVPAAPFHLLALQVAAVDRSEEELTVSTELSLKSFDRASLFRGLRKMFQYHLIEFYDTNGDPTPIQISDLSGDSEIFADLLVAATPDGTERALALRLSHPTHGRR